MISRSYKSEALLVLITLSVVAMVVLFNDINKYIRIKELKIFLQRNDEKDNNLDHIGLVMKYRLNKRLYEDQISEDDANLIEMRVNSILSEGKLKKKIAFQKYQFIATPALYTINFFRSLIGKKAIADIEEDKSNVYLEISYYYERNKHYEKALELYNKALNEENYDRENIAGILLHQGFCHSILGNYKEARKKYNTVIEDYADESIAITAAILLRYLEGFTSEINRVLKYEKDSVVKGEKLYKLIAYKESYQVLERIEENAPQSQKSKIQFFKGRCLEELAEKEEALETYQKIIIDDHESSYAKLANRRIYAIGSLAHNGSKIEELAIKNNQLLIKDDSFSEIVDEVSNIEDAEEVNNRLGTSDLIKDAIAIIEKEYPVLKSEKLSDYDTLVKKIDEKIKKEEKNKEEKEKRRRERLRRVKIYTNDGNIFVGTIKKETNEDLVLKTIIGRVAIEKNKILKREKL